MSRDTAHCALFRVMTIFNVYIVSKAGGLIYWHTHNNSTAEVEATFTYPLDLTLEENNHSIYVKYGEKHGIEGEGLTDDAGLIPYV